MSGNNRTDYSDFVEWETHDQGTSTQYTDEQTQFFSENAENFNDIYDVLQLITSGTMTRSQIASLYGDIIYKGRVSPLDTAKIKDTFTESMIRKYEWLGVNHVMNLNIETLSGGYFSKPVATVFSFFERKS